MLSSPKYLPPVLLWAICALIGLAGPILNAQTDISSSYSWNQLLIGGGGFVTGVAIHPTTPNLIYARTDTSGAYKWNSGTGTWNELLLSSNVPSPAIGEPNEYAVESIAVSAQNDQVVYVAIGTDTNGRILKSTNQGQTWSDSGQRWYINGNGDYREGGERLAVDPSNDSIVYFGSRTQGLWVSTNAGSSWSQVSTSSIPIGSNATGTAAGVSFVAFDPTGGTLNGITQRIYVGVASSGIYETSNGGSSWSEILSVTSIPYAGKVAPDGTLWVSLTAYEANGGLQTYNPSTQSWTNVSPADAGDWSFAIDPFNPQRVITGHDGITSGQLYQTTNEGASWSALQITLSSPNIPWVTTTDEYEYLSSAEMQFDSTVQNRLWFPEGLAIWQADDSGGTGITFSNVSEGIENTIPTDVIAPNGVAVTGIFDREGFYHGDLSSYPSKTHFDTISSSGPQLWGGTSLDYSGGNSLYQVIAEVQNNSASTPSRGGYSTDGGNTWTLFSSIPAVGTGGNIAVSASDTTDIVWLPSTNNFGVGNIPYYTTDQGASWNATSGISSTSTHWFYYWGSKKALDSDKVIGDKFYLVTFDNNGTFYVSTDGGASFQQAPYAPPCSESDNCHYDGQLRGVPGEANNVWSSNPLDGLYYTTDAGQTAWTQVAGVQQCDAFGFGQAAPGASYPTVFIAGIVNGTYGVFSSIDQGASWQLLSTAPLGIYNQIMTINGDMTHYGMVYLGFDGNGFAYGNLTSGTDAINGVIWPAGITPSGSATLTVQYSATTPRTLTAYLWDSNWNWKGQVSQTVPAGTGSVTLTVPDDSSISTSTAYMRVVLTDGGSNTYATEDNDDIPVTETDTINSVSWPASITSTGSAAATIQYSATTSRTLTVYLWDSNWNWMGQTSQTVPAGTGTVTLTVQDDSSITTNTAFMRAVLTDGGSNTYATLYDYDIPVSN